MRSEWLWRGGCALLVLIVPALVAYDVYFHWRAPGLDFPLDIHTGRVLNVPADSLGNYAGLMPGDVIQTVDGRPYTGWQELTVENHQVEVRRGDQLLTLELPVVRSAKVHLAALATAVAVALTFWGVGGLLLLRRPHQKEVRLVFLLAQTCAVLLLFPLAHPAPALVPVWGLRLSSACLHLAAPLLLHLYLSFPVQLGTRHQRRGWLGAAYGAALIAAAVRFLGSPLARWGSLLVIGEVAAALAILIYVYLRRATPDGRRRVRLVMFSNLVAVVPPLLFYVLPELAHASPRMPEWLVGLCLVTAPLSYLYATVRHNLFGIDRLLNRAAVYAILSLGILLLYAGPLLLLYRFLPGDPSTGSGQALPAQALGVIGLALGVGLTFDWTRRQVQRWVDRLFYGGWYDYPGVVEIVSDALARTLEREQLTEVLTRQTPALMQLHPGHLDISALAQLTHSPIYQSTNSPIYQSTHSPIYQSTNLPTHQSTHLTFPLVFQGQTRGLWTVGPRRDGDDFTPADRRILATLAREAEIALGNVLLVETLRGQLDELRASRASLAQAQRQLLRSREEERGRLARELHDGPIQVLVGLNIQLGLLLAGGRGQETGDRGQTMASETKIGASHSGVEALAGLVGCGEQPAKASSPADGPNIYSRIDALAAMRGEVRELLADLRQVCAELRPPMLDTLGLGAALRALAEEWSGEYGIATRLDLPADAELRLLPGEATVNLYRVVQEALTNVARHAGASTVSIRLAWEGARLVLTIADNGRGFSVPAVLHDLTAHGHFGLAGMAERVALIGGAMAVTSAPGQGTTIRVECEATEAK